MQNNLLCFLSKVNSQNSHSTTKREEYFQQPRTRKKKEQVANEPGKSTERQDNYLTERGIGLTWSQFIDSSVCTYIGIKNTSTMSNVLRYRYAISNPYSNKIVRAVFHPRSASVDVIQNMNFFLSAFYLFQRIYSNNSYVIISAFRTRLVDQIQTVPPSRVGLTARPLETEPSTDVRTYTRSN